MRRGAPVDRAVRAHGVLSGRTCCSLHCDDVGERSASPGETVRRLGRVLELRHFCTTSIFTHTVHVQRLSRTSGDLVVCSVCCRLLVALRAVSTALP